MIIKIIIIINKLQPSNKNNKISKKKNQNNNFENKTIQNVSKNFFSLNKHEKIYSSKNFKEKKPSKLNSQNLMTNPSFLTYKNSINNMDSIQINLKHII